jgi:putative redox protein
MMAVEVDITYEGGLHCTASHGPSGNTITTDAPVDNGGRGEAFSPTDLVAAALGTCIITVMALVAQRSGIDLKGTRIHVIKEMTSVPVRRIKTLAMTITLPRGVVISDADRKKLQNAAYACPVKQSLHPDVEIIIDIVYP